MVNLHDFVTLYKCMHLYNKIIGMEDLIMEHLRLLRSEFFGKDKTVCDKMSRTAPVSYYFTL